MATNTQEQAHQTYLQALLIFIIRIYQRLVSPIMGNCCRYYPSCSNYTLSAIQHHGCTKGSWLGMRRILRCHPFSPGGFDPVPDTQNHLQK